MDAGLLLILALGLIPPAGIWAYKTLTQPRRGPWTDTTNHAPKGGAK